MKQPERQHDENAYSEIVDLLLLFDDRSSQETMDLLASLSSYYLGAYGGELYTCIVLRKGTKILPAFEVLQSTGHNDCIGRLGLENKLCFSGDQYQSKIELIIRNIEKNQSCYLER
jgi:hypothetical protein